MCVTKTYLRSLFRKTITLFLILYFILPAGTNTVWATDKSASQGLSYLEGLVGTKVGTGQCVALVTSYYSYLGVSPVSGNACDYATNSLPSGWTRVKGGVPQAGDILVYTGATYGHVVIYAGGTTVYQQNWNGKYVEKTTNWNYDKSWYSSAEGGTKSYWGYIRPNFNSTAFPGPEDTRYSAYLPAQTYAISTGKVTLYDYSGNAYSTSTRYIDGNSDLCEILKIYTNGYCEVKYPSSVSSTGYNTLIAKFSDFSPSPNPTAYTADRNYPSAYRRATGSETIGSVDINDKCLRLATSGSRTQVIYPTPSKHKIGWIEIPAVTKHMIDLNRTLYGTDYGALDECGTADIYINGSLDADDVSDYYKEWPEGTKYEIKDIKTNEGYAYKGMKNGSLSGTVGSEDVDLRLIYVIVGKEMSSGYDRRLPDGDYLIASAADPSYYLDIQGTETSAVNGSNVVLTGPLSYYPGAYDIWTLTYSDGYYSIRQKNSNASLDVKDGSVERSANVQVWEKNNNSCQKWAINYFDGGKGYRIQSKCSGMSLDIEGGSIENQINVQQYTGNSTDAQRWLFIPYEPQKTIEDGRYILTTGNDHHVELDVPGDTADVSDGANIRIWNDKCPSKYNSFDVKYVGNGYYHFVHAASGKYLEVNGSSTDNYGNIQLWSSNGCDNQKWCIIPQNGGYMVVNRNSGLAMDVEDGKTEDGTNVRQHYYNGAMAQTWFFEKAEYKVTYNANGGTNAPAEQVKYYNEDLTLQTNVPERTGYQFLGWADGNASSATADYSAGGKYKENRDTTLYAVWQKLEPDLLLPSSMDTIEEEAFEGGAFKYVKLAEGVKTIEKRAFADCPNLKDIYIPEETVRIATDAFEGVSGLTIHGREGSYAEFYAQKFGFGFVEEP